MPAAQQPSTPPLCGRRLPPMPWTMALFCSWAAGVKLCYHLSNFHMRLRQHAFAGPFPRGCREDESADEQACHAGTWERRV